MEYDNSDGQENLAQIVKLQEDEELSGFSAETLIELTILLLDISIFKLGEFLAHAEPTCDREKTEDWQENQRQNRVAIGPAVFCVKIKFAEIEKAREHSNHETFDDYSESEAPEETPRHPLRRLPTAPDRLEPGDEVVDDVAKYLMPGPVDAVVNVV